MDIETKTVTVDVNEAFLVKTDTGDLCRLCANTDNQLIPIFRGEGIEHNIHSKIEKHLPIIKVTELDKLPLQICYQCASTLIAWHNLYEGCRVADKRLRELLSVDEKIYQDEAFVHYVDDYRDDYEDEPHSSYDGLPLNPTPSTSNLPSDILKTSTSEITQLEVTKPFNETELDSTDERCQRIPLKYERTKTSLIEDRPVESANRTKYFICGKCKKVFLKQHNYLRHLRQHSTEIDCDKCGKLFEDYDTMCIHKTKVHSDEMFTSVEEFNQNSFFDALKYCERVNINGRKFMKCTLCSFLCRNMNAKFFTHFKQHSLLYSHCCEICGKQFRDKYGLDKHLKRQHHNVREFTCSICERMFFDRHHLKQHVRIHTGERPFVCEICGKTFTQVSSLAVHKKFHLGEKKHICQLCGKRFITNSGLLVHIRRHTGERNHACQQCGKRFVSTSQLKSHVTVHSNDRPFMCSDCGAGFKLKKNLKLHCVTHLQND